MSCMTNNWSRSSLTGELTNVLGFWVCLFVSLGAQFDALHTNTFVGSILISEIQFISHLTEGWPLIIG